MDINEAIRLWELAAIHAGTYEAQQTYYNTMRELMIERDTGKVVYLNKHVS